MQLLKCGHVVNALINKVPGCAICNCIEIDREVHGTEGLEGRKAKCGDHKPGSGDGIRDSNWELPFFRYRGPGSFDAEDVCAICGYRKTAHVTKPIGRNVVAEEICPGFKSHGPFEYDEFYCGCWGWD